jgi:predicted amidophosphoribosyltransferase
VSVEIKPRRLRGGPWKEGYALHVHMLSSSFIGYDGAGHPRFDSTRSPVGELLYQLKYRGDRTAAEELARAAAEFLKTWAPPVEGIVPVPPSVRRREQPVLAVATAIAKLTGIPLMASCLSKIKATPQLKDVVEYNERKEVLGNAFGVEAAQTRGKSILLFDDLFGSGATVGHIAQVLKTQGKASAVYLLTLTTK